MAGGLHGTSYIIDNPAPVPGVRGRARRFDSDRDGVGFGGLDALTWVATPGHTVLYADGVRVGAVDASLPLPLRSIGTEKAGLRGDLDDLITWDEALSPAEAARLK
ncbi:hypothetical protein [Streptomyces sp. KN37]|uniref:hypothetical protein n=1 Tax=Streptomyces sp. KN37 TaxID=3090667 RepID=UPI002A75C171|nr:hypothetical protein [Streptomyces sp. KN37]WPO74241.1 hypothetical protein R9806_28320 [Streptomyces sp. KN37]